MGLASLPGLGAELSHERGEGAEEAEGAGGSAQSAQRSRGTQSKTVGRRGWAARCAAMDREVRGKYEPARVPVARIFAHLSIHDAGPTGRRPPAHPLRASAPRRSLRLRLLSALRSLRAPG